MKSKELTHLQMFDAIMRERSVTRAADQLAITQPALSNAISRMRDMWRDPLFVKKGRQLEPTAYALDLWQKIKEPLESLARAVEIDRFDNTVSERSFHVAVPDWIVDLTWAQIIEQLRTAAPNVKIHTAPYSAHAVDDQLRAAQIDLAIGFSLSQDTSLITRHIIYEKFVVAIRRDHPLSIHTEINAQQFSQADHLLVSDSHFEEDILGDIIQSEGLKRNVVSTVNHYSAALDLIQRTDCLAMVPGILADDEPQPAKVKFLPGPIGTAKIPILMKWHARNEKDEGMQWLVSFLSDLIYQILLTTQNRSRIKLLPWCNRLSA